MTRLTPIAYESLTDAQKAAIADRPARARSGPYTVWLRRPDMTEMATVMMRHLRHGGLVIPDRLTELVILVAARAFKAQFAWHSHAPQALAAGIDAQVIEAIRQRRTPAFKNEDEALIYAYANELIEERSISDATHQRALAMWGEDFLIDLVNLIGCYMMIAVNLVAFQVDAPDGENLLP
jgi:4-carboxymuconolactone decarboxylase